MQVNFLFDDGTVQTFDNIYEHGYSDIRDVIESYNADQWPEDLE